MILNSFTPTNAKAMPVMISIRVDNKGSNNADMQFASLPVIVRDKAQKFTVSYPNPANPLSTAPHKKLLRPEGKPDQVIIPDFSGNPVISGSVFAPETFATPTGRGIFRIDPNRRYFLTGKFRYASEKKATFYLGVIQYDKNNRQIYGLHINRIKGTESRLSHAAAAGTSKLMVFDASKWRIGGYAALGAGLPCRDLAGPVENIERYGGDWGVFLKNPLKTAVEADTAVAQHMPMNTHLYLFAGGLTSEFTEHGGEIKWWPGAKKFQFILLGSVPVEFKDIKLEIYQNNN